MAKERNINPGDIDANFVISSFKNKERLNNPNSVPRPLLPPEEKSDNSTEEKEAITRTETAREDNKRRRSKSPDYESLFLVDVGIPTRSGKLISIREKYHERITKIVQVIGKNNVSIFSYIDNVLSHHFDTYQDEITELYNKNNEGIF